MGISVCNTSSKVNSKETLDNKRITDQMKKIRSIIKKIKNVKVIKIYGGYYVEI